MEFKVIPVTNGKIIIEYLSLHLLCLPTLSLFATKYLLFFIVSLLDVLLPVKGVGLGFYRRKSLFILCYPFTFQVVGCPQLTT